MYSKFILIFLIVVLVGLVLFLGGYLLSPKNQTANLGHLNRFDQPQARSEDTAPQLRRLSTVRVISPSIAEDGRRVLFFEVGSGKILASDFLGKEGSVVSGKLLSNLSAAYWAANGYETIIVQNSRGELIHSYFNVKTGQIQSLHPNLSRPAWSPRHDKIAYLFFDRQTNEGQISISNPDGSVFKNILPTRLHPLAITWPKEDLISFYDRAGDEQSLFILEMEGNSLKKILGPVNKLQTLWAPDSSKILASYTKDGGEIASIMSLKDQTEIRLDLLTSANKCAWSANSVFVYCGAKKADDQLESLYAIDTTTQSAKLLFTPFETETVNIKNPFFSPAEDFLIFTNDYDQYLYSISL